MQLLVFCFVLLLNAWMHWLQAGWFRKSIESSKRFRSWKFHNSVVFALFNSNDLSNVRSNEGSAIASFQFTFFHFVWNYCHLFHQSKHTITQCIGCRHQRNQTIHIWGLKNENIILWIYQKSDFQNNLGSLKLEQKKAIFHPSRVIESLKRKSPREYPYKDTGKLGCFDPAQSERDLENRSAEICNQY